MKNTCGRVLSLAVGLGLLFSMGCGRRAAHPSIVLISLDTTRADHLEAYGYDRDTTPTLSRLAREGIVFDQAVTVTCHTLFSHASMLTGLFPAALGFEDFINLLAIRDEYRTLAEDFRAAGYQTGGFTAHGDWLNKEYGFAQGFDSFSSAYRPANAVLEEAAQWLARKDGERPFFLFIHLFDAHSDSVGGRPYQAPPSFEGRYTGSYAGPLKPWPAEEPDGSLFLKRVDEGVIRISENDLSYLRDQYDEGLAFMDDCLGRFLDQSKVGEDAYVLVTADHGEEFQDHGGMLHGTSYDEIVRVPMILVPPHWAAAALHAPRRVKNQVCIVDLRPTLLRLAALPAPTLCEGADLTSWLEGLTDDCPSGPVPLNINSALRYKQYKFIRNAAGRPPMLFDLVQDPRERRNIVERDEASSHAAILMYTKLNELNRREVSIRDAVPNGRGSAQSPEVSEDAQRRLKELGY